MKNTPKKRLNSTGIILPKLVEEKFKIRQIREYEDEWIIDLIEKKENIPESAKRRTFGKKVVLNGYRPHIEITDYPLRGKIVYLRLKRRRWKIEGTKETYENQYKITAKGLKCTHEFGAFLKELGRYKRRKFFRTFPNIRHIQQKDFTMVSRIKRFLSNRNTEKSA